MHWADLQWTGIQSRRNKSIFSPLQPYCQGLGEGRRETLETRLIKCLNVVGAGIL